MLLNSAILGALSAFVLSALVSCGAPTKTAKSVSDQLDAKVSDRMQTVCTQIVNEEKKIIDGLSKFEPNLCVSGIARRQLLANSPRLNLDTLATGTRKIGPADIDTVIDLSATSTVQFGISFAQFASQISRAMSDAAATGKPLFDPAKKPNGSGSFQDLITMETIERKKIEVDQSGKNFAGAVEIKSTTIAPKVTMSLEITGKVLDDSIAIRFQSAEPKPFSESLIEQLRGIILLVPYDNDILAFLYVDVGVHDLGIGEQSMARQISQSIGSSFQMVFDGLAQINR